AKNAPLPERPWPYLRAAVKPAYNFAVAKEINRVGDDIGGTRRADAGRHPHCLVDRRNRIRLTAGVALHAGTGILSGELPQCIVSGADSRATILRCGYDVDILETGFSNDTLIGYAIQRHSAGQATILAGLQSTQTCSQI